MSNNRCFVDTVPATRYNDPLDNKTSLDLVLIVECTIDLGKFTKIIKSHYRYFIKSSRRQRKKLRVSLVKFWDLPQGEQVTSPTAGSSNVEIHNFASTDEEIKKMFDSAACATGFEKGKGGPWVSQSMQGGNSGLANALYKVSNLTFRRDANKVCILLGELFHSYFVIIGIM